jgi:hypothetical protein
MTQLSQAGLAQLLTEAGAAHHKAYIGSDGFDPEWATWYAPFLQARIGDGLGRSVTRSELTYLLLDAERRQAAQGDTSPWPEFYAGVILAA